MSCVMRRWVLVGLACLGFCGPLSAAPMTVSVTFSTTNFVAQQGGLSPPDDDIGGQFQFVFDPSSATPIPSSGSRSVAVFAIASGGVAIDSFVHNTSNTAVRWIVDSSIPIFTGSPAGHGFTWHNVANGDSIECCNSNVDDFIFTIWITETLDAAYWNPFIYTVPGTPALFVSQRREDMAVSIQLDGHLLPRDVAALVKSAPEPATTALLALGLFGAVIGGKQRRSRRAGDNSALRYSG
jgi:hypothetical protein